MEIRMLYEFYCSENAKKPRSVNASYIIAGVQQPPEKPARKGSRTKDGEDAIMQSSPFMPSSMPQPDDSEPPNRKTSIILVREEDMEGRVPPFLTLSIAAIKGIIPHLKVTDARATFESIFSIHIYSLQPTALQDLNVLTDVRREMLATYSHEDPMEHGKTWGMIQNKHVKV
jgi:DNA polymerase delta subunit 3